MLVSPPVTKTSFKLDAHGGDIEPLARFVAASQKGKRNHCLYWATRRAREHIAKGSISETIAERRLGEAAKAAGIPEVEAQRTIRSGLGQQKGPK
jgi:hypothetical protein